MAWAYPMYISSGRKIQRQYTRKIERSFRFSEQPTTGIKCARGAPSEGQEAPKYLASSIRNIHPTRVSSYVQVAAPARSVSVGRRQRRRLRWPRWIIVIANGVICPTVALAKCRGSSAAEWVRRLDSRIVEFSIWKFSGKIENNVFAWNRTILLINDMYC